MNSPSVVGMREPTRSESVPLSGAVNAMMMGCAVRMSSRLRSGESACLDEVKRRQEKYAVNADVVHDGADRRDGEDASLEETQVKHRGRDMSFDPDEQAEGQKRGDEQSKDDRRRPAPVMSLIQRE